MICKRKNNQQGFTLAEILMAVAILIILMGVSFIGVNRYMRSMALLERDGVAKEIFIAAQNHLTMAQGQGYLGVNEFGALDGTTDKGFNTVGLNDSITNVMLPFGSIDETVRGSGNYYIRYQKETGRVLDVFYWTTDRGRFDLAGMDGKNLDHALAVRGKKEEQKNFSPKEGIKPGVLGWFGGESAAELPARDPYLAPEIEVHNEDVLYLKVTNRNTDGELIVYVEGVESGTVACFNYGGDREGKTPNAAVLQTGSTPGQKYIVLDDVANPLRLFSSIASFSDIDIKEGTAFIPGEDIRVYAEAYKKGTMAGVGRSATQITNSLYQSVETTVDPADESKTDSTIYISNFRHLENLYDTKSKVNLNAIGINTGAAVKAEQTEDLFWNTPDVAGESDHSEKSYVRHVNRLYEEFDDDYSPKAPMIIFGEETSSAAECYVPVSPSYELVYNGAGCAVWDVKINYVSEAGLIGNMKGGSLSNLELINFNVTSSEGNVGALAGSLETDSSTVQKTQITNVVAYNTERYETSAAGNIKTTASDKSAGGLIGSLDSSATGVGVTACAAALYVDSAGDAGGLVGSINGPFDITNSYSGGHTIKTKAVYYDQLGPVNVPNGEQINVIGGRNAGGLVGSADLKAGEKIGKIEQCYSTCSVYTYGNIAGLYAGGLVGKASNGTIASCYATGYVSGAEETSGSTATVTDDTKVLARIGQFVGNLSGATLSTENPNWYYMIVNERANSEQGITCLSPVGGATTYAGITALDATAETYNSFSANPSGWNTAQPYDSILGTYYQNKYNLKTVEQLGATLTVPDSMQDYIDEYFVKTHYGDWPAPEIFVINEK